MESNAIHQKINYRSYLTVNASRSLSVYYLNVSELEMFSIEYLNTPYFSNMHNTLTKKEQFYHSF